MAKNLFQRELFVSQPVGRTTRATTEVFDPAKLEQGKTRRLPAKSIIYPNSPKSEPYTLDEDAIVVIRVIRGDFATCVAEQGSTIRASKNGKDGIIIGSQTPLYLPVPKDPEPVGRVNPEVVVPHGDHFEFRKGRQIYTVINGPKQIVQAGFVARKLPTDEKQLQDPTFIYPTFALVSPPNLKVEITPLNGGRNITKMMQPGDQFWSDFSGAKKLNPSDVKNLYRN